MGMLSMVLLIMGIALIVAGIIMYWFQICFGEANCLKRTRKTSIVLGLVGWALLIMVLIPPIR